jgi:hypothetical protein
MSYDILIRKNATGEIRTYTFDCDWEGDGDIYWLTEGNYGCDCNRFLCFERAVGIEPDWDQAQCGEGDYSILSAILPGGERIDIDDRH